MRPSTALSLVLLSACARGEATTSLGHVVVDTVGHGVVRTMTESPVGWRDTSGWKLIETARIVGGTEGPGDLGDPQSVTLGADGTIYVFDHSPLAVKKYSPAGRYLRTLGREGEGPGEFEIAFLAVAGGTLFLHDPRQGRTSAFDTSGVFRRSWLTFCCYATAVDVDGAGDIAVPGPPPHDQQAGEMERWQQAEHWFRPDSTLVDSTLIPAGPPQKSWDVGAGIGKPIRLPVPFSPSLVFGFLPDRGVVVGTSDQYQLAVTRGNGADTVALFGRRWSPAEVPAAMRHAEIERMVADNKNFMDETLLRNAFVYSDVPATAPAFDWIGTDAAGDLWIRNPVPDDTTRSLFDVFDPQFRWLGQVAGSRLLRGRSLRDWGMGIAGDRLYGFGEDDRGNPVVVVYRIERGG